MIIQKRFFEKHVQMPQTRFRSDIVMIGLALLVLVVIGGIFATKIKASSEHNLTGGMFKARFSTFSIIFYN